MSDEKRLMHQPRKDNPIENIIAFLMDERSVELTDTEHELKDRYLTAFKLMLDEDSLFSPAEKLVDLYDVSLATAYNYINNAQIVFGNVKKFNKEAWRFIQIERKRRLIERAKTANNLEVEARLERDIDKLLDFDKDPEKFNPEKFAALQIQFNLSRSTKTILDKLFSKGSINLNNVTAQDIGFEEID